MTLKWLLPAALALCLGACQSTKFDPKASAGLETITLIGPSDPQRYVIDFDGNAGNAMAAAGLVGFLIAASIDAANSTDEYDAQFTQALIGQHDLKLGTELRDAIKKSLEGVGYQVITELAPPPAATEPATSTKAATDAADTATKTTVKTAAKTTEAGSASAGDGKAATSSTARLLVEFEFVGYVDRAFVPFKPWVLVTATMTDGKTRKELFRQRYNYSDCPASAPMRHIAGLEERRVLISS